MTSFGFDPGARTRGEMHPRHIPLLVRETARRKRLIASASASSATTAVSSTASSATTAVSSTASSATTIAATTTAAATTFAGLGLVYRKRTAILHRVM